MEPSAREIVLYMACDEYTGPWEVVWDSQTRASTHDRGAPQEAALDLLSEGLIAVFYEQIGGEIHEVPLEDAERALRDPSNWQAPKSNALVLIRVATTTRGDEVAPSLDLS